MRSLILRGCNWHGVVNGDWGEARRRSVHNPASLLGRQVRPVGGTLIILHTVFQGA